MSVIPTYLPFEGTSKSSLNSSDTANLHIDPEMTDLFDKHTVKAYI